MSVVVLRRFVAADVTKLFAMSQQRGMRVWIPDQVYADEDHARRVLAYLIAQYDTASGINILGVCLGDELIGHVGLSPLEDGIEIGYAIDDAYQGKGLATEAVRAMAQRGPSVIDAIVATENAASCRVLEKAGFVLVEETTRPLHGVTRLVRRYRFTQGSST